MGISEAFYIPAALALIADYHTGPTRSRAIGFHQMGIYTGVMIGGFAGFIADSESLGWRKAFDFTGVAGILYAVPLLFLIHDAPRIASSAGTLLKPTAVSSARELLTNRSFLLLAVYFTIPAAAAWMVRDWMPAILLKSFNISQGKAGVSASLYWQAAAWVSAVAGGIWADRWMRTNQRGRIYVSITGTALIIPALFAVGNAGNLNSFSLAIAGLILFGFGWGFYDCNNMPILCQVARPELRATGYGVMNFLSMVFGFGVDWTFGILSDRKVPLNLTCAVFAAGVLVSIFLILLIRPRSFETTP
jgi:MFS family permease